MRPPLPDCGEAIRLQAGLCLGLSMIVALRRMSLGQREAAIADYDRGHPPQTGFCLGLCMRRGVAWIKLGNRKQAIADFEKALGTGRGTESTCCTGSRNS